MATKAEQKFYKAMNSFQENINFLGVEAGTEKDYEYTFKIFSDFMRGTGWKKDAGYVDIQAWRNAMMDAGKKTSTIAKYMQRLNRFYKYASSPALGESRFYDANPFADASFLVPNTRKAQKRPYEMILTDEQVMRLCRNAAPKSYGRKDLWARNYAIIMLLLASELRNRELRELTMYDLDFQNSEIVVEHGKGDKFRVVDFPLLAQTAVRAYLNSGIRPAYAMNDEPLFGTTSEHEFRGITSGAARWHEGSRQWLSELVRKHVLEVTGVDNVRSHDLRHVGARIDLNAGMRMEELQQKLGHEQINTTEIYSGRLTARRNRIGAKKVQEEMEAQAKRNIERLELSGDYFFDCRTQNECETHERITDESDLVSLRGTYISHQNNAENGVNSAKVGTFEANLQADEYEQICMFA